jgi:hypothetical protein
VTPPHAAPAVAPTGLGVLYNLANHASDFIVNLAAAVLILIATLVAASWAARLTQRALIERLRQRLEADPRVVKDPPPLVEVTAVTEGFVEIAVRPWAARNDYGALKADILLCARLLEADPDAELPPLPEGGQHGRPAVGAAPVDQNDPSRPLRMNPGRRPQSPLATSS